MKGGERAAGIGMAFAVAYVLLLGGTSAGMVLPEARIVSLGTATIALGTWALVAWRQPEWRPRSVLLPVLVAGLVVMSVSALASRSPRVGAESIAQAAILGSGYLLLVEVLRRPGLRSRVLFVAGAVGLLVSIGYIAEILYAWSVYWTLVGHISTPPLRPDYASLFYGNPSPMLAMAVLLAAVLAATVPFDRRGVRLAVGGIGIAAIAALLTGTRAGWLGVALGMAAVTLLVLVVPSYRSIVTQEVRKVARSPRLSAAVGGLVGAGMLVAIILLPGLLRRVGSGGEEVRTTFYAASIRMAADHPLVGVGPGMWPLERATYTAADEPDFAVAAAHNLYLHTVAEMGALGIVLGVAGAIAIVVLLRDGLRDTSPERRRWGLVAVFATVYFAIHSLLDFLVNTPSTLLAVALPLAILDATTDGQMPWAGVQIRRRGAAFVLGTSVVVTALGFAWWTTPGTTAAGAAARAGNVGAWADADVYARKARGLDPGRPAYQFLEGLTAAHVGDATRALRNLSEFAATTDTPEAWIDVAALRLAAGETSEVQPALVRASRLGLQHPALAIAIADLALRTGDEATAITAASSAIAKVPSLAADPWWSSTPPLAAIYPDVVRQSLDMAGPDARWEISLMVGDVAGARASAAGATDPSIANEVIAAWLGDTQAADRLLARCDVDPLAAPIGWCARVSVRLDRPVEAARYAHLGVLLRIDQDLASELRVRASLINPSSAGGVSAKAGASWRQPVLWDVLVPGVARLANPLGQLPPVVQGEVE